MKNRKVLLVLIAALVLLIGGASLLYSRLGQEIDSDQLAVQDQTAPQQNGTAGDNTADNTTPEDDTAQNDTTQDGAAQDDTTDSSDETTEPELTAAPDFIVYDRDGNEVHLYNFLGKPIVVNFWASWCGPCKMEMPDFEEKYLALGDEIQFLMVNLTTGRETMESADAFIADAGYTFPVFYDTQSNAAVTYGAYSIPTTFFIDAEGHAIARATGAIDAETLQRGIDMIFPAQ